MSELIAPSGGDYQESSDIYFDLHDTYRQLEHVFDGGQGLVLSWFEPTTKDAGDINGPKYLRMRANVAKEGLLVNDYDIGILKYDEVDQPIRYFVEVFRPMDENGRELWDFSPSAESDQLKHYIYSEQTREFLLSRTNNRVAFAKVIDDVSRLRPEDCKERLGSHQMADFKLAGLKEQGDIRYGIEIGRLSMLQYVHET